VPAWFLFACSCSSLSQSQTQNNNQNQTTKTKTKTKTNPTKAVHAARPGEEPTDLTGAPEDVRLLDATCADPGTGAPLCLSRRRAHFGRANGARAAEVWFDPGHVYTITFYNHEVRDWM
jgi:hypothetical protein